MDRNELKIQALLEKVSSLTANYENQVADLRVELTLVSKELAEKKAELESKGEDVQAENQNPEEQG